MANLKNTASLVVLGGLGVEVGSLLASYYYVKWRRAYDKKKAKQKFWKERIVHNDRTFMRYTSEARAEDKRWEAEQATRQAEAQNPTF